MLKYEMILTQVRHKGASQSMDGNHFIPRLSSITASLSHSQYSRRQNVLVPPLTSGPRSVMRKLLSLTLTNCLSRSVHCFERLKPRGASSSSSIYVSELGFNSRSLKKYGVTAGVTYEIHKKTFMYIIKTIQIITVQNKWSVPC